MQKLIICFVDFPYPECDAAGLVCLAEHSSNVFFPKYLPKLGKLLDVQSTTRI